MQVHCLFENIRRRKTKLSASAAFSSSLSNIHQNVYSKQLDRRKDSMFFLNSLRRFCLAGIVVFFHLPDI